MATRAYGRMVFWEGASLWVFGADGQVRYPKTTPHEHHAVQITLSLRGTVTLESGRIKVEGESGAVAPDTEHTFEVEGVDAMVAHLFVDPEGHQGRALQTALFATAPLVSIASPRLGALASSLRDSFDGRRRTDKALIELGRAVVELLAPGSDRDERPELRVRKMSAWAADRLDTPISLADVAKHVNLSTGRARHLFVEETGLPFRTYLLWLRLNRAVALYSGGSSLTEAAHGAGFSDSAHLSRTFRRMFGVSADTLRVQ